MVDCLAIVSFGAMHVAGLQGICVFPVLCEMNGGTTFLFCTVVLYFALGIPVVLVESGLGQLGRQSPAALFQKLCPLLSGVYNVLCLHEF
jgi:SNF family Na+-dependent transporter